MADNDQTINRTPNPDCPCCKKQIEKIKGAMHTKAQWRRYHKQGKDIYVDPTVKRA